MLLALLIINHFLIFQEGLFFKHTNSFERGYFISWQKDIDVKCSYRNKQYETHHLDSGSWSFGKSIDISGYPLADSGRASGSIKSIEVLIFMMR